MSTLEQVLELIETLTPEEVTDLQSSLAERIHMESSKPKKRILGLHAHLGEHWISPDFDDYLGDDFWLGDANDPLYR